MSEQQRGVLPELAKKKNINFESSIDVVETNQSSALASSASESQLRPTRPSISDALVPSGRCEATSDALGNSELLPIIVVR